MKTLLACLTAGMMVLLTGCQAQPTPAPVVDSSASCTAVEPSAASANNSLTACANQESAAGQPTPPTGLTSLNAGPVVIPVPESSATPAVSPTVTLQPAQTPTSPPLALPTSPAKTAPIAPKIKVYTTTLSLPTYPIWDYLVEQVDPVYNLPVSYFNRPVYESAHPTPTPKDYQAVVLENEYLRLTFLPQLGGRLYSALVKATQQEIFYHNPVVKPSRYGVLQPYEANWWLATGGMEWAYPTQEHGYRFGVPWQYRVGQSLTGATIILSDTAPGRVGARVSVTLPVDSPVFTVSPQLVNQSDRPALGQFWLNAALTLGAETMSPQTRFIWPTQSVIVHSRGAEGWSIPDAGQEIPWPLVGQTDLSDYNQWANYLGMFAPYLDAPFMGAFNPDTGLAVARLIEPGQVAGSKLFAFGRNFPDKSYTDDGSQYFEIWGGANTAFWPEADVTVPPGGALSWQESWWPLAGLGGLTWANNQAALHARREGDSLRLSLLLARPGRGTIKVLAGETSLLAEPFTANPAHPLEWTLTASGQPVRIQVIAESGEIGLDYLCEDC